ncbi:DNA primase [Acinetobacter sp.]|uniref:DNA primase n=1 Tax=Acinetobacter sp. TaxID=472 RepID=UPI0035AFF5E0
MAIPQHTIDQILDRTDIVELINQRVKLKKTGRTYSGCCPFHQEKTPSFHVYRDKAYYHCFGCQANGNAIRFLMEIDNRPFIDVMKDLAQHAGIELPKDNFATKSTTYKRQPQQAKPAPSSSDKTNNKTDEHVPPNDPPENQAFEAQNYVEQSHIEPIYVNQGYDQYQPDAFFYPDDAHFDFHPQELQEQPQEASLYDLLEAVASYFQQQLKQAPHAQNYFQNRGLSQDTIDNWRLGYAPTDWQHLEQAFPQDIEGLKLVGLIRESDQGRQFNLLRDRVIFPIRDAKGRVVGFGGRALNDEIKPKYINSPDSEIFHKNQLLYGLYEGRKAKAEQWLMVEGYMDVIALHQSGIHGAVATLGTASNAEHLNILFRQNNSLTLAFDGDSAGQKAAWRTLEIALPLLEDGRQLHFFILPDQHDPDSLIQSIGQEAFLEKLGQSPLLSDFLYAQLTQRFDITSPEGKGQVMGELRQLSQQLPNGSYKYLLSQSFKDRLGFGRRNAEANSNDLNLSFGGIDHSQLLMVLLLHFPKLYKAFETLRALLPEQSLIKHFLDTLDRIEEQLPHDVEVCRVFVLGACSHLHPQLLPLLNKIQLSQLGMDHPEDINKHAEDLYHRLQVEFLRKKLKQPASIKEMHNLKQQLNDAYKQLSRSEIRVEY